MLSNNRDCYIQLSEKLIYERRMNIIYCAICVIISAYNNNLMIISDKMNENGWMIADILNR